MTPRQRIELRRSEIRERLAAVAELTGDKLTEEVKTERGALLVELRESEPQLQAAIAAEPETRAMPSRDKRRRIRVRPKATDGIRAAIRGGKRYMSVEFRALDERTTKAGVREVLRALVEGAALVDRPEYDSTLAEVRGEVRIIEDWTFYA